MVEEGGMDAGVTDLAQGKQRGIRHSRVESAIEDIRSRAEHEGNVNYKRASFCRRLMPTDAHGSKRGNVVKTANA